MSINMFNDKEKRNEFLDFIYSKSEKISDLYSMLKDLDLLLGIGNDHEIPAFPHLKSITLTVGGGVEKKSVKLNGDLTNRLNLEEIRQVILVSLHHELTLSSSADCNGKHCKSVCQAPSFGGGRRSIDRTGRFPVQLHGSLYGL